MIAYALAGLLLASNAQTDLAAHLQTLKASMQHAVPFTEEQGSVLLESTLISSGILEYRPTDRALIKRVIQPEPAQLTVLDNTLIMESSGRSRKYSLRSRPEMLAMLGGFRSLIEGDRAALERHFHVQLTHEANEHWQLALTPLSESLAEHLSQVRISGRRNQVWIIETTMTSGDWQRLRLVIGPIDLDIP